MVYKLAEEDKLCGVEYINWDKHYSPITKATCKMLKGQCPDCYDDAIEVSCEDIDKLLHGDAEKPKEKHKPETQV